MRVSLKDAIEQNLCLYEFTSSWGTSFNLVEPDKTRTSKTPHVVAHLGSQNWSSKTSYVCSSAAHSGFGPLIYDIALNHFTKRGMGLTSDRTQTSDSAIHVWSHYYYHRPDVNKLQFDSKRVHRHGLRYPELNHEYKLKILLDVSELILNGERLQQEVGFTREDVVVRGASFFSRSQRC